LRIGLWQFQGIRIERRYPLFISTKTFTQLSVYVNKDVMRNTKT
jgi:hypothetical protein